MKTCNKCKQEFPATLEYFYKDSRNKNKLGGRCRPCKNKDNLPWKMRNPEKVKLSIRKWNLNKLGFTLELFDEMLNAQGNMCALCGSDDPGAENWNADHDHKTGKARGLLCWSCNVTLGHIEAKDPGWTDRAKKYINEGGFYRSDQS